MRVARPRWTAQTDEQRAAIIKVEELAAIADAAEGNLRTAIAAAHQLGIPVSHLAEFANRSRVTVHKHLRGAGE